MKQILKYLCSDGDFLYEKWKYRITEGESGHMGAAKIVMSNDVVDIILRQEAYGAVTMCFSRHGTTDTELPLELFRYWITGELRSASVNLDEFGQYLHNQMKEMGDYPVLDSDGHKEFIIYLLGKITEMLNDDNYMHTKRTIEALASRRADILFG